MSAATLRNALRRIRFSVISAKNRSTWLSHEVLVGEKGTWTRGRLANQRLTRGALFVGRVVVHHQMDFDSRFCGDRLVNQVQELEELLLPMALVAAADHMTGGHIQGSERVLALRSTRHESSMRSTQIKPATPSRLGTTPRQLAVDRVPDICTKTARDQSREDAAPSRENRGSERGL